MVLGFFALFQLLFNLVFGREWKEKLGQCMRGFEIELKWRRQLGNESERCSRMEIQEKLIFQENFSVFD